MYEQLLGIFNDQSMAEVAETCYSALRSTFPSNLNSNTVQLNLYIEKGSPTEDIKRQFNFYYPYLKIEFYSRPFIKQSHASKKDSVETNGKTNLLGQFNCSGIINITANRTVRELETEIATMGLYGQVLRKSGHMWIETVLTNDWTLQHQNYEGEQISSLYEKGVVSPDPFK